jgi:hypothetical protein
VQYVGQEDAEPPDVPEDTGLVFELEDFSETATWERVNVYNGKRHPRKRFEQRAEPSFTVQGVQHTLYQFSDM